MKSIILLLLIIGVFFGGGCRKQHSSHPVITYLNEDIKEEKYLSSIFKNPRIIPLETLDESLIGRNINKIRKRGDKYYVSFDNKTLVIFDRQGKFLQRIHKKGRAPEEYISLVDFDVLPNGNIVIQDVKKLLLYSSECEFIKAIPLDITCYNLKVIDEDHFLICASGQKYIIYLINGEGHILSEQLARKDMPVWGVSVVFFAWGKDHILYQQDCSNDFLSFNTKTKEFVPVNLLGNEEKNCVLSIETVNQYRKQQKDFNSLEYVEHYPGLKVIRGFSSYTDYMFFALGSQSSGFKCYLLNACSGTIDYLLTENTLDDFSFTNSFALLGSAAVSDAEDCFITYAYPYQIVDGLIQHKELNEHPNYQYFQSLFKDISNIQEENPVLIELSI